MKTQHFKITKSHQRQPVPRLKDRVRVLNLASQVERSEIPSIGVGWEVDSLITPAVFLCREVAELKASSVCEGDADIPGDAGPSIFQADLPPSIQLTAGLNNSQPGDVQRNAFSVHDCPCMRRNPHPISITHEQNDWI